jgi:hypothetical protein
MSSPKMSGAQAYILISCVGQKRAERAVARDLYISPWFQKARAVAETSGCPWFILSAEYGLVSPDEVIAPYEKTLNTMGVNDRKAWAQRVTTQMDSAISPCQRIAVFAGSRYREFLMHYLQQRAREVIVPLEGLRIGEQLSWLSHAPNPLFQ